MLELVDLKPGYRVLDIGCGPGELTEALRLKGQEASGDGPSIVCMGMDADENMIRRAKEQFPLIEFFVGDVRDFTLPEPVDVIFSNAALHWVPPNDAERAVIALSRALKSGGQFVVEFGGKGNLQKIVEALEQELLLLRRSHGNNFSDTRIQSYYPSISEYSTLLERHDIEVQSALLFDRPTLLDGGDDGMKNWLRVFRSKLLESLDKDVAEDVMQRVSDKLRPDLFDGKQFTADYRRIRVVGRKL